MSSSASVNSFAVDGTMPLHSGFDSNSTPRCAPADTLVTVGVGPGRRPSSVRLTKFEGRPAVPSVPRVNVLGQTLLHKVQFSRGPAANGPGLFFLLPACCTQEDGRAVGPLCPGRPDASSDSCGLGFQKSGSSIPAVHDRCAAHTKCAWSSTCQWLRSAARCQPGTRDRHTYCSSFHSLPPCQQ